MTTNALSITNLSKKYKTVTALDSINLQVPEGSFFGLLGPNGAGKSTTIGILTGLVMKTSGEAKIFGHETTKDYKRSRQIVGVVPQEFNFDTFQTVEKSLLIVASYFGIPRNRAYKKIDELLDIMELKHKKKAPIVALSGGMKRRLLIVRALLHNPKILILDEPTAGVDVELRRKIWEFTQRLNKKGVTILLTTHYLEEAEALCDRIAIIHNGKIILDENKEKIMNRLTAKYYLVRFPKSVQISSDLLTQFNGEKCSDYDKMEHMGQKDANAYHFHFDTKNTLSEFLQKCFQNNIEIKDIFAEKERLEDFFVRFLQANNNK